MQQMAMQRVQGHFTYILIFKSRASKGYLSCAGDSCGRLLNTPDTLGWCGTTTHAVLCIAPQIRGGIC
jgi:hypothetical protein